MSLFLSFCSAFVGCSVLLAAMFHIRCSRFACRANDTCADFDGRWWSGNENMTASAAYTKTFGMAASGLNADTLLLLAFCHDL